MLKLNKLLLLSLFLTGCATEREHMRERQFNVRECIERFISKHNVSPQDAYNMCIRIYSRGVKEVKKDHSNEQ